MMKSIRTMLKPTFKEARRENDVAEKVSVLNQIKDEARQKARLEGKKIQAPSLKEILFDRGYPDV